MLILPFESELRDSFQIQKSMMKKLSFLLLVLFVCRSVAAVAAPDEGMWLLMYIKKMNEQRMKELGLQLSAEDIYSETKPSLKDAVVSLGGFCTAEIVSPKGMLFTNHHCAYDAIATLSTPEDNYLKEGFWASSYETELPVPGLTASILVKMDDVTEEVRSRTDGITDPAQRQAVMGIVSDSLVQAAIEGTDYTAEVKEMFYGNEYYIFVYDVFRDIRLVGAPPSSIGKFGGDTDNWMWPRHTGDFSVLRIYADENNEAADYSPDNKPYTPKHFIPISLKGVDEDDFSMIIGFPGRTERYLTSYDIKQKFDNVLPAYQEVLGTVLQTMKTDMDADSVVELKLASNYASLSNAFKYYKGQYRGLKQNDLEAAYAEEEGAFQKWVEADPERKERYGEVLPTLGVLFEEYSTVQPGINYFLMGLNTNTFGYGVQYYRLGQMLEQMGKNAEVPASAVERLRGAKDKWLEESNLPTEKKLLKELLTMMATRLDPALMPSAVQAATDYKGKTLDESVSNYVDYLFRKSVALNPEEMEEFLEEPKLKTIKKDPFYALVNSVITTYREELGPVVSAVNPQIQEQRKLLLEGLRLWKNDENFYPDANSTPRLTYGIVTSYEPRDAVIYDYYTTHMGILQKADPTDDEFQVPDKLLKQLIEGDFSRYGENDSLRICFISNNDITGGNSGSPVMDAEGNLIGIAFDGNWEAMIGDILVVPELNRTISVDIRYVLYIIDKFAGAEHIMDELVIVEAKQKG